MAVCVWMMIREMRKMDWRYRETQINTETETERVTERVTDKAERYRQGYRDA